MTETKDLQYVGRGLGAEPKTQISPSAHVTWKRGVTRTVPAHVAADLLRDNPGQFVEVEAVPGPAAAPKSKAKKKADETTAPEEV